MYLYEFIEFTQQFLYIVMCCQVYIYIYVSLMSMLYVHMYVSIYDQYFLLVLYWYVFHTSFYVNKHVLLLIHLPNVNSLI